MSAEQVMRRSGRTFHLASRLLPAQMRADAFELYSYCRLIDDLADNGSREEHALIAEVVAAIEVDPLGDEAASYGWPVDLEARFPHISAVALRLTRALAADAGPCRIATEAALHEYAFGVAGTVGIMMCRILGAPPEAAEAAADLGIAMQLTNIARDVREDLGRDRIYLPASWIEPSAVEHAVAGGDPAPLVAATHRLLALAERYYVSGDAGLHHLAWRARASILAARLCYREIGQVVAHDVPLSWRRRAVVPASRKARLVAEALTRAASFNKRISPEAPHCRTLRREP